MIISNYSHKEDAPQIAYAAKDAVSQLMAEILRLTKLPYRSWKNEDRIRSLDKQIEYLEQMMAQYESDVKKHA